ncbi:MAG: hypothetical protein JXA03_11980 [Bacteroidales bacterium]|nr:hypothetical protein [Bacteroidales bacterium]
MNEFVNELNDYVKDVLGYDPDAHPVDNTIRNTLPLILRNKYAFYDAVLEDHQLVIAVNVNDENTPADQLRKQLDMVYKAFGKHVVYVTNRLKSYNRKRFINKKIAFIVPGKQMYIPYMMIDLQDFGLKGAKRPEAMTPSIQYMLLYHLLIESLESLPLNIIAEKLNVGPMTITRAAAYMQDEINVCRVEGTREKNLVFHMDGSALWKKVEPYMATPVKKTIFVTDFLNLPEYRITNVNALANYTNIAGDNRHYMAMADFQFNELLKNKTIKDYGDQDGETAIETWKYDPVGLTRNQFVDPLSLYLVFRDDPGERIQIAINQMLEDIKW